MNKISFVLFLFFVAERRAQSAEREKLNPTFHLSNFPQNQY
jgi:hypothetical protein